MTVKHPSINGARWEALDGILSGSTKPGVAPKRCTAHEVHELRNPWQDETDRVMAKNQAIKKHPGGTRDD